MKKRTLFWLTVIIAFLSLSSPEVFGQGEVDCSRDYSCGSITRCFADCECAAGLACLRCPPGVGGYSYCFNPDCCNLPYGENHCVCSGGPTATPAPTSTPKTPTPTLIKTPTPTPKPNCSDKCRDVGYLGGTCLKSCSSTYPISIGQDNCLTSLLCCCIPRATSTPTPTPKKTPTPRPPTPTPTSPPGATATPTPTSILIPTPSITTPTPTFPVWPTVTATPLPVGPWDPYCNWTGS